MQAVVAPRRLGLGRGGGGGSGGALPPPGLDVRAVQEWEQGRRVPDRAARVLLTVIDRDPESVVRALAAGETGTGETRVPAP